MNFLQMSYDGLVTSVFGATQWSAASWIVTVDLAGFTVLFGLLIASQNCEKRFLVYALGIATFTSIIADTALGGKSYLRSNKNK